MAAKWKLKKGDTVIVLTGRDKGKKGEILKVNRKDNRVLVQGVNLVKKHQKQTQNDEGGIITKEMEIHVSNVSFIDPEKNLPTRLGWRIGEKGDRTRVAKRSGKTV